MSQIHPILYIVSYFYIFKFFWSLEQLSKETWKEMGELYFLDFILFCLLENIFAKVHSIYLLNKNSFSYRHVEYFYKEIPKAPDHLYDKNDEWRNTTLCKKYPIRVLRVQICKNEVIPNNWHYRKQIKVSFLVPNGPKKIL